MVHFHHRCYTKKMIQKAKRRLLRKTQKVRKLLRHEPEKLLTVDELYSGSNLTCKPKNDILKHIETLSANYTKQNKTQQNIIQELKTLAKSNQAAELSWRIHACTCMFIYFIFFHGSLVYVSIHIYACFYMLPYLFAFFMFL